MNRVSCVLAALACSLYAPLAHAAKATHNVTYGSSALATTLWYPDGLSLIRGVLVFTGGQGSGVSSDTRAMADDRFWQRFGESVGFAIIGDQFTGSYTNAANGPGMALLDSLTALANETGHPELEHVPLLVEGFSNGGYFSFTFAQFVPARVIAFCVNKSGFATAPLDAAFLAVPGFLVWGSEEPATHTPTVIHDLVTQGRKQHALWAELREWGAQHEDGSASRAFAPFFAEMIAARYPASASPLHAPVALTALREEDGFLGDHSDASVGSSLPMLATFAAYGGDKTAASWLPSEGLANVWRGFVTKSPIGLDMPGAHAQLDANQTLPLQASGIDGVGPVRFLAGAALLVGDVAVSGGQAKASWTPDAGGVRGLLAVALDASGAVARISRPADVVLYGKPPALVMGPVAGNAGGGAGGAAGADDGGAGTAAVGGEAVVAGGAGVGADGVAGAGGAGAGASGTGTRMEVSMAAGGGCSVARTNAARHLRPWTLASLLAGWVMSRRRRRCESTSARRHRRPARCAIECRHDAAGRTVSEVLVQQ
jgi:hypothetical protein